MSVPPSLANLVGEWSGNNLLWLSPLEPARESSTSMIVALAAQGQFLTLHYTWAYEGKAQDGLLLVGSESQGNVAHAAWVDSWHMQDKFMLCQGTVGEDGSIILKGAYAAPPGPDWGWQINLAKQPGDQFQLEMYNITPKGASQLAVEAMYSRKS
jgi:hypothetical protein